MTTYLTKYREIIESRKAEAAAEVEGAQGVLDMLRAKLAEAEADRDAEVRRAQARVARAETALAAAQARAAAQSKELTAVRAEAEKVSVTK